MWAFLDAQGPPVALENRAALAPADLPAPADPWDAESEENRENRDAPDTLVPRDLRVPLVRQEAPPTRVLLVPRARPAPQGLKALKALKETLARQEKRALAGPPDTPVLLAKQDLPVLLAKQGLPAPQALPEERGQLEPADPTFP